MLGGFLAWVAITIIGEPIHKFVRLRTQAAVVLARYEEQVDHSDSRPKQKYSEEWLSNRQIEYSNCGSDLIAFAAANIVANGILRKLPKGWRCFPHAAGGNFLALATLHPDESWAPEARNRIISALRLGFPR